MLGILDEASFPLLMVTVILSPETPGNKVPTQSKLYGRCSSSS